MLDNERSRGIVSVVVNPVARALLKTGLTPSAVTVLGSMGAVAVSVLCIAQGKFVAAGLLMIPLAGSDLLDGTMARLSNTVSPWGSFLDSTTDRITDGAIFGAFVWWALDHDRHLAVAGLVALVAGFVTSYARAKAESLGVECKVGIAERAERVVGMIGAAGFWALGVPYLLPAMFYVIAIASCITVWQRMALVHRTLA